MAMVRTRVRTARRRFDRACFCAGVNEASRDEPEAVVLYKKLIENAPNEETKRIITSIRNDEAMHTKMFKAIDERFRC